MDKNVKILSTQEYDVSQKNSTFFYGWIVLLFSVICVAVSTGVIIGVLPHFYQSFINDFGWNRTVIGLAGTIALTTRGLAGLFTGGLFDRYGPKRFMIPALFFVGITMLYGATISMPIHFYILAFSIALCVTLCGLGPNYYLASSWFKKNRGIAMGVIGFGVGIGGLLFPPLTARLIVFYGWRVSMIIFGVVIICIFTPLIYLFIRNRPEDIGNSPDPKSTDWYLQNGKLVKSVIISIAASGLFIYSPLSFNESRGISKNVTYVVAIALFVITFLISRRFLAKRENVVKDTTSTINNQPGMAFKEVMSSAFFWILLGGTALSYLLTLAIRPHFVLHVQSKHIGFSPLEAAWAYSTIYFFSIVGGSLFGYLSDKHNKRIINLICAVMLLVANLILIRLTGESIWLFCFLYGLSSSGLVVTVKQLLAEQFGHRSFGTLLGITLGTETIFGGIGTLFMGRIYDITGSYTPGFKVLIICTSISVLLMSLLLINFISDGRKAIAYE